MDTQLHNRRATLFVSGLQNFTENVLSKYISEFSNLGLLPSVNKGFGIKITPNGIEPEDVISLDLKKLDETLKVAFGPDRIDIVSTQTNETLDSFCKTIIEISSIVNKIGMKYNRLALCANISYALDNGQGNLAYAKLTKNVNEYPVEWQIRKVIRKELENTKQEGVWINYVYTLSRNDIIVNNSSMADRLILDLDFNTLVGTSIEKIADIQDVFWKEIAIQIDAAIGYYEATFKQNQ